MVAVVENRSANVIPFRYSWLFNRRNKRTTTTTTRTPPELSVSEGRLEWGGEASEKKAAPLPCVSLFACARQRWRFPAKVSTAHTKQENMCNAIASSLLLITCCCCCCCWLVLLRPSLRWCCQLKRGEEESTERRATRCGASGEWRDPLSGERERERERGETS